MQSEENPFEISIFPALNLRADALIFAPVILSSSSRSVESAAVALVLISSEILLVSSASSWRL